MRHRATALREYAQDYRDRLKRIKKPERRDVAEAALSIATRSMIDEKLDMKHRDAAQRALVIQLECMGFDRRQAAIKVRNILDRATGENAEIMP